MTRQKPAAEDFRALAADDDARVRFQTALSLGACDDDGIVPLLATIAANVGNQRALHVERHRGEVNRRSLPGVGDLIRLRGNLFVCRTSQPVNEPSRLAFVEQPRAHTRTAERMDAAQIGAAPTQRLEGVRRIVVASDAHQSRPGTPQRCAERAVQDRATRLPHPRRAIRQHDIIDEQVAQQHDGRRHWPAARRHVRHGH